MGTAIRGKTCNRRANIALALPNGSKTGINGRTSRREIPMNHHSFPALLVLALLPSMWCAAASAAEIKGPAILDHPCGKVAVKQMGLMHAGKFDEANKLTTKDAQDQWKAMPAKDRAMMEGMMKDMSQSPEQFAREIRANGVLVVDGTAGKLTVKTTTTGPSGSSTSTTTQSYVLSGNECLVSR
jgi:hypothetical protein